MRSPWCFGRSKIFRKFVRKFEKSSKFSNFWVKSRKNQSCLKWSRNAIFSVWDSLYWKLKNCLKIWKNFSALNTQNLRSPWHLGRSKIFRKFAQKFWKSSKFSNFWVKNRKNESRLKWSKNAIFSVWDSLYWKLENFRFFLCGRPGVNIRP